jgi:hypothetical protein
MGRPPKGVAAKCPLTEAQKVYFSVQYRAKKLKAMQVVVAGGLDKWTGLEVPKCVHCGCDNVNVLEFNHLHTTHMERGGDHNRNLWEHILQGKVDLSDLEIACRVCNAKLFLDRKFGPQPFTITWK